MTGPCVRFDRKWNDPCEGTRSPICGNDCKLKRLSFRAQKTDWEWLTGSNVVFRIRSCIDDVAFFSQSHIPHFDRRRHSKYGRAQYVLPIFRETRGIQTVANNGSAVQQASSRLLVIEGR